MGEPKFTPGPWKWWTSNSWRRLTQDRPDARDGGVLCPYVSRSDGHPDCSITTDDMALIAAAPALYEELANLRRRFHAALIGTGTDPEFADAAVANADAALAKARGEQPA